MRKINRKWGIIQIRTLVKNGGIIQMGGKCSENKINIKMEDIAKNVGES